MKGIRPERMAESIRAEIGMLIATEVRDPRVAPAGLMTVTAVKLSGDLGVARVLVSFVGGDAAKIPNAMKALERSAAFLRGEIGRRLGLRRAPELRFEHDTTAEKAERLEKLMRDDGGDR